ncbi:alkaline phosphatase PhoX [Hyphobacterium sp. HN65]|uniref:Alkaline phosphatase PhoX n=1 Tax=Hyphobacterium lacteum TaxID=3116575 RepID=A0ABU7LM69_9PROT|nr:alkaline phosphatase PhoX [Hyphobacterium sp. HN65]MEE2525004.1 alkaline phosphatase PhoX [Hyphobacterium sp. HN65]
MDRRQFLKSTAAVSAAFTGFALISGCARNAAAIEVTPVSLVPDPEGLLDLPPGFSYSVISTEGEPMSDGLLTPGDFDGMAAFDMPDGLTLIRNHELSIRQMERSAYMRNGQRIGDPDISRFYDPMHDGSGVPGGTTTLVLDPDTLEIRRQFLSLVGTYNNCAGGPTPWGSWLTCEETVVRANEHMTRDHGYVFEVPAGARELVDARALTDMGRFRHEAVAVDPATGIVYLTEDDYDIALFYRFIPNQRGNLAAGGRLQCLKIREVHGLDTRNWEETGIYMGESFAVEWMDVDQPDNPDADLAERHVAAGAAQFTRGEGIWFGDGELYFTCTDGGRERVGQIFRYIPSRLEGQPGEAREPGRLELFIESPGAEIMDYCDNICIAPWGDLIVAEDGQGDQYIRGVTPAGRIYTIARNAFSVDDRYSEFCGPCFSPDGNILFLNVQSEPSRTFAIRGPWQSLGS